MNQFSSIEVHKIVQFGIPSFNSTNLDGWQGIFFNCIALGAIRIKQVRGIQIKQQKVCQLFKYCTKLMKFFYYLSNKTGLKPDSRPVGQVPFSRLG